MIKFEDFKEYVYKNLKENGQFEYGEGLERDIKSATGFYEIKDAIDRYWGWEDEQTVWLLEGYLTLNMG